MRSLKLADTGDKVVGRILNQSEQAAGSALSVIDDLREQVKAGEVVGVAVVVINSDGSTSSCWSSACAEDSYKTIAAFDFLKMRFMETMFDF